MADAKSSPSYSSDLNFSVFQNRPDRGALMCKCKSTYVKLFVTVKKYLTALASPAHHLPTHPLQISVYSNTLLMPLLCALFHCSQLLKSWTCKLHCIFGFDNKLNFLKKKEASLLDRIKMTKNWLEYDRKIFTTTNLIF